MLFRRRTTYYYDPETCTYQKRELTTSQFIGANYGLILSIFAICAGALYLYFAEITPIKEASLEAERQELMAKLEAQNSTLDEIASNLNGLYDKETQIYTTILDGKAIAKSVWEGGRGGSENANLSNLDPVAKTKVRMDVLSYRINLLNSNYEDLDLLFEKVNKDLKKMPSILPVRGKFISGFGNRIHPISGGIHFHTGLDFKCPSGTPVYATGDGIVAYAHANNNGYGIHIDIDHLNGYETKYAHLSQLEVKKGQAVKRGDIIGYSGNTGMSTGPHLHYEIKHQNEKIDPLDFFYFDLLPAEFLQMKLQAKDDEVISLDY